MKSLEQHFWEATKGISRRYVAMALGEMCQFVKWHECSKAEMVEIAFADTNFARLLGSRLRSIEIIDSIAALAKRHREVVRKARGT